MGTSLVLILRCHVTCVMGHDFTLKRFSARKRKLLTFSIAADLRAFNVSEYFACIFLKACLAVTMKNEVTS